MPGLYIFGRRYAANFRFVTKDEVKDHGKPPCDRIMQGWYEAEGSVRDSYFEREYRFVIRTPPKKPRRLREFKEELLGVLWVDNRARIVDLDDYTDAVLGELLAKCKDREAGPTTPLTLVIGEPDEEGHVDLSTQELIARGIVRKPDGQRAFPLPAG